MPDRVEPFGDARYQRKSRPPIPLQSIHLYLIDL